MLLVKYGEIALKSQSVRRRFEQQLVHNIEKALMADRIEASIVIERGVVLIYSNTPEVIEKVLSKTFGIVYYSNTIEVSSNQEEIEKVAEQLGADYEPNSTFAVKCKRSGSHPYSSMELAARLGEVILDAYPEKKLKVNLTKPQNLLTVEVRNNKCHIYTEREKGLGGMPVGTQGRALLVVPPGKEEEASIAGWLALKRGVRLFIYLEKGASDVCPKLLPWGGPTYPVEAEDAKDALKKARCIAFVLPDTAPVEKPDAIPPTAILYPLAGLPKNKSSYINNLINAV